MASSETTFETVQRHLVAIWTRIGVVLHALTSPIILFGIFFFIFTPYAILVRVFRRHPSFDKKSRSSYWLRTAEQQPGHNFQRQF